MRKRALRHWSSAAPRLRQGARPTRRWVASSTTGRKTRASKSSSGRRNTMLFTHGLVSNGREATLRRPGGGPARPVAASILGRCGRNQGLGVGGWGLVPDPSGLVRGGAAVLHLILVGLSC